jgi:hypothetical protein
MADLAISNPGELPRATKVPTQECSMGILMPNPNSTKERVKNKGIILLFAKG